MPNTLLVEKMVWLFSILKVKRMLKATYISVSLTAGFPQLWEMKSFVVEGVILDHEYADHVTWQRTTLWATEMLRETFDDR